MASRSEQEKSTAGPSDHGSMMEATQMEALIERHRRLAEHLMDLNRGWVALIQDSALAGSDLSARLLICDKNDVGRICAEWYGEQVSRGLAHARDLGVAWTGLATSLLNPAGNKAAQPPQRESASLKAAE